MSDVLCRQCGEPWEYLYLRHEAVFEHPGEHAPQRVLDAHRRVVAAWDHDQPIDNGDMGAVYHALARGNGCPACWGDPGRVATGARAAQVNLDGIQSLFDSTDDDPAQYL